MIIYKVTNKINGKVYIGQTTQKLEKRWKDHCKKSNKSAISLAVSKYGEENFKIKQILVCESVEQMNKREVMCIKMFNSLFPNGYNIEIGGKNRKLSESTRKKLSDINKNTIPPNRKGCFLSRQHKMQISAKMKGRKKSKEQIQKFKNTISKTGTSDKKIKCLNNKIIYKSMSEAVRQLGISVLGISRNVRGQNKSYKGFKFVLESIL